MGAGAHIRGIAADGPRLAARRNSTGALWRPPRVFADIAASHAPRRGVSLLESILFLAIALSITLGGLAYFRQTSDTTDVSQAVRELTTLIAEARTYFARQADFAGLTPAVLIAAGAVPRSMINSTGNAINSPWGAIDIGPAPGNPSRLVVTMFNLSVAACTRLGPYSAGGAGILGDRIANLEVLGAGGDLVAADPYLRAGVPGDGVTPAEAAAACSAAGTATTRARWTFVE